MTGIAMFRPGSGGTAAAPKLPVFPKYGTTVGTSTGDLAAADRANIAYLFGTPNFNETDTLAAERAVASGTTGSGFAANNQLRLRDSERINRYQIGHQMLDPYLQREQQSSLQGADNAARLQQIAAQGEEARKQLELQQSGQMALQSAEARARLEQIAAQGAQAMEQLKLSELGDTNRVNINNAGALERTVVGGAFDLASRYGAGGAPGQQGDGRTRYGTMYGNVGTAPVGAAANSANIGTSMQGFPGPGAPPVNPSPVGQIPISGGGSSLGASATRTVDEILSRYGLN